MKYQCEISIEVEASSPEEAAIKAQDIIDESTIDGYQWVMDVRAFDGESETFKSDVTTVDCADLDTL